MSETVKIELPVVRDVTGRVACRNEARDKCLAFVQHSTDSGYVYDWDCAFNGVPGVGNLSKQTYYPIPDMGACPIVAALRAEGKA